VFVTGCPDEEGIRATCWKVQPNNDSYLNNNLFSIYTSLCSLFSVESCPSHDNTLAITHTQCLSTSSSCCLTTFRQRPANGTVTSGCKGGDVWSCYVNTCCYTCACRWQLW